MKKSNVNEEVSTGEKLAFGAADLFGGGAQALITAIYTVFLTMNGVPIAMAGLIVGIAKIWDAISDPLMGVITDNTRSRWGRRKPYLVAGGLLVIVSFAWLFVPMYGSSNVWTKFAVYLSAYLFYSTVATIITVPYYSFSTEISTSYQETTKINAIRLYFSMASSAISAVVPMLLIDKLQSGAMSVDTFSRIMVLAFGLLYCIPLVVCGLRCKERAAVPDTKTRFSYKSFVRPLSVKAFRILLGIYLCAFTCMDVISSNIIYFAKYGIAFGMPSFVLLAVIMIAYVAMMPVLTSLMKKGRSKPALIKLGIPLYIIGAVVLCLLPKGSSDLVAILLCVVIGVGMSGCQMMPWIIFPDVVDIAELKLHDRPTGSFSGLMTFARKTTAAIAIALTSLVLTMTGFVEPVADASGTVPTVVQPISAQWGLRLTIMITIVVLITVVYFLCGKLHLSQERSERVKLILKKQEQKEALSEEDQAFCSEIAEDLF